jgi:hypothetical protein
MMHTATAIEHAANPNTFKRAAKPTAQGSAKRPTIAKMSSMLTWNAVNRGNKRARGSTNCHLACDTSKKAVNPAGNPRIMKALCARCVASGRGSIAKSGRKTAYATTPTPTSHWNDRRVTYVINTAESSRFIG